MRRWLTLGCIGLLLLPYMVATQARAMPTPRYEKESYDPFKSQRQVPFLGVTDLDSPETLEDRAGPYHDLSRQPDDRSHKPAMGSPLRNVYPSPSTDTLAGSITAEGEVENAATSTGMAAADGQGYPEHLEYPGEGYHEHGRYDRITQDSSNSQGHPMSPRSAEAREVVKKMVYNHNVEEVRIHLWYKRSLDYLSTIFGYTSLFFLALTTVLIFVGESLDNHNAIRAAGIASVCTLIAQRVAKDFANKRIEHVQLLNEMLKEMHLKPIEGRPSSSYKSSFTHRHQNPRGPVSSV